MLGCSDEARTQLQEELGFLLIIRLKQTNKKYNLTDWQDEHRLDVGKNKTGNIQQQTGTGLQTQGE